MASPDYLLCDKCNSKINENSRVFIGTNRYTDAAGSNDTEGFNIDLCSNCWGKAISAINNGRLGIQKYELGLALSKWVEINKKDLIQQIKNDCSLS